MRVKNIGILIFNVVVTLNFVSSAVLPESDSVTTDGNEFVLPEGIPTCKQNDPDLSGCIKAAINQQLPILHKGSKILNIPPLDPLKIPDGRYQYTSGPVGGTLIIKNVNVYGISKSSVKKVDTHVLDNGLTSTMLVYFPRLYIEGNYKADVKINELKMRPKGYFNLTLSEVSVTTKTSGDFELINGNKHLVLKNFDVEPEIGDLKVFATGLFPDPAINTVVLDFANQYWPELVKTVLPQTKSIWEPLILESANKFLRSIPIDKLLTKDEN
ncbi:uncharacterized protein LOC129612437 [Condylostylus longicornis]|uniref:uncharacterized protein LOC129612437 n=1 Tax=Condylostylus longicornis TaxID=2530218 RepID=UPI00244DB0C1|nr:uncharacterized protein LOC129612437 [Condylostylus longicornis]